MTFLWKRGETLKAIELGNVGQRSRYDKSESNIVGTSLKDKRNLKESNGAKL